MFTAADMRKAINKKLELPDLDEWIENDLKEIFLQRTWCNQVIISASIISRKDWEHDSFYKCMIARGFGVSFTSEQRDGDFYTITLPQAENN